MLRVAERRKPKLVLIEELGGPTPETKRRLKEDPILRLWRLQVLDTQTFAAASEIRGIIEQIADRFVRSPMGRLELLGTRVQASPHPLDGVPVRLQERYLRRYIPWAKRMGERRCGLTTYMALTFAVLIDGVGPRTLERRWGLAHGRVSEVLVEALRDY